MRVKLKKHEGQSYEVMIIYRIIFIIIIISLINIGERKFEKISNENMESYYLSREAGFYFKNECEI
jgi:hypothetical protein